MITYNVFTYESDSNFTHNNLHTMVVLLVEMEYLDNSDIKSA